MEEALSSSKLSDEQVQTYLNDGVLVVNNVLDAQELAAAKVGLKETLARHGILENDPLTAKNLVNLSSTNGSGGVLDLFYEPWKFQVALHPNLFAITSQLWSAAYSTVQIGQPHPYGSFDVSKGYMYLDRIGYRLPSALAQALGSSKKRPIQRSLTPHLDCCPETFYDMTKEKTKWRPIQCFVSLSDALLPNQGGFEAVKGFHREFHAWNRQSSPDSETPAPCIGDYTHIRPREDKHIMDRVEHIPVAAGSAVFWDERIPHANSYRHTGTEPRAVVYCSFLPDISLNRTFAKKQLGDWRCGVHPRDQWIQQQHKDHSSLVIPPPEAVLRTPLERQLAGLYLVD